MLTGQDAVVKKPRSTTLFVGNSSHRSSLDKRPGVSMRSVTQPYPPLRDECGGRRGRGETPSSKRAAANRKAWKRHRP